ncbi:hypothetical protein P879_07287 [Paragonimus westermani]|uniref:LRP2-binding protein n=1 Tax=Paragonimus westermani TaxID=34504 RepID=A0A8T0D9K9_9TREM|nr:hypothetical protein P879_07287 [Paragonimus westermani]
MSRRSSSAKKLLIASVKIEADDLLNGLPFGIRAAELPPISSRLKKELVALEKITDGDQLDAKLLNENLELLLARRIGRGDKEAPFQLGQLQFENVMQKQYCSAWKNFQLAWRDHHDMRAKYQMGVMLYDELLDIDELREHKSPQAEACKLFEDIIQLPIGPAEPGGQRDLVYSAAYNLGRAYYQGFGYYPSTEKAIEYFKLAANDGDPKASILAQTALGYLYSGAEHRDLAQSFYWHSEACGNGSVESQAAIGVMYLYGLGVKQDWANALICLSEAASHGSLYGKATLAYFYYKRKMFTNAAVLANRIAFFDVKEEYCIDANCLKNFLERAKAMGCFIYARCLQQGLGVAKDEELARELFSKSVTYDAALAARYQRMVQHGDL